MAEIVRKDEMSVKGEVVASRSQESTFAHMLILLTFRIASRCLIFQTVMPLFN